MFLVIKSLLRVSHLERQALGDNSSASVQLFRSAQTEKIFVPQKSGSLVSYEDGVAPLNWTSFGLKYWAHVRVHVSSGSSARCRRTGRPRPTRSSRRELGRRRPAPPRSAPLRPAPPRAARPRRRRPNGPRNGAWRRGAPKSDDNFYF